MTLLLWHCCCDRVVVTLLLWHCCCDSVVVTVLLCQCCFDSVVVTLLLWHCCCDAVVVTAVLTLLLWHNCCDTVVVTLLWQMGDLCIYVQGISLITNIYTKKTKGPTLMEFFTAIGKLKSFFLTAGDVRCVHHEWHGTHRYDIQVLATHTSTWVHQYSSLLQWSVTLGQRGHVAMVGGILCTKCTLHSNHRLTRVIFQHTTRLLSRSGHFLTTYTRIA